MLAIKKRHTAVKAITAGSVAFAIGLTGAAAFVDDNFQPNTTVYNQGQESSDTTKDPVPIKNESNEKDTGTSGDTKQQEGTTVSGSMTQPADSSFAPAPSGETSATSISPTGTTSTPSTSTSRTVTQSPTSSTTSPTTSTTSPTTTTGGSGGTTLLNDVQNSCPISCLTDTTKTLLDP